MPVPSFAGAEALQRAQADAGVAVKRCEELEAELQQLKASSSVMSRLFQMPTKQDVLAGLGLELWKDDQLHWKTGDVEVRQMCIRILLMGRCEACAASVGFQLCKRVT